MGVMGKIVGGTLGLVLGGPLGAILGAAFGHAFDLNDEGQLLESPGGASSPETAQATFFVATFSMLAKLVRADGRVSQEEVDSINRFMSYDLNLDEQGKRVAMNIFNAASQSGESFEGFANQFYAHFHGQRQLLDLMIDIMLRVALADGYMSPEEEQLIKTAVSIFRFTESDYQQIKSRYVRDTEKYYAVLGLEPGASVEAIKKQYRRRVSEFHPDKIASKGLPEEFTKFAAEKFKEIQDAYEKIKAEKGFH